MGRFDSAVALGQRLIAKNGAAAKLRRLADAIPADPSKPWEAGAPTPTEEDITVVRLPLGTLYQPGQLEPTASEELLASALATEPALQDNVLLGGVRWDIVRVDTVRPNGVNILHTMQVRR